MGAGACSSTSIPLPGSGWWIIVWDAPYCSPIEWIGALSRSRSAIPASKKSRKSFAASKDGDWLGWGPMYHWTDRKIRIHAFYCMLGISLLQHLHKQAQSAWNGISTEQLLEELRQIQQFVLLYPPQGEKGPNRIATVLSKQTLSQQALAKTLGLDQLHITQRR